jgi:hypothetical protein
VDRSQQTNSTRDSLRKIRQETRQTRSLEVLRQHFEQLQNLRRQSLDDFDLQVMIGDIHQEIVDRARYLRGDAPTPSAVREDHSVIFQAKPAETKPVEPAVAPLQPAAASVVEPTETAPPAVFEPMVATPPKALPEAVEAAASLPAATPPKPLPPPPTRIATKAAGATDAAEIPPEVTRIDATSWQTILGLAAFLCVIALAGIFYLIQAARRVNFPEESRAKTEQTSKPTGSAPAVSISPTLRLYTDLTAGTVTIDDGAPRGLVDGELMLDNLPVGQHSFKLAGSSGSASFQFEVVGKSAPKVIGVPQASNALAVLVSEEDGHGQLVTSTGPSEILVDGNSAGQATAAGLELVGLGATDHDLQVVHDRDRQRFVMTYTPAPVLTVYVKSDPNTGIIQVVTGEDGVEVYIEDALFRRRTEHGQVRISIRAGRYPIRVHKDGFTDPPMQWVEVKKADVTQAAFEFAPSGSIASLQIRGAQPGTTAYIDHDFVAAVGPDGTAKVPSVKPGEHTIELRHDLAVTKRLQRTFRGGEALTLAGPDVTLEKSSVDSTKPGSPAVVVPVGGGDETSKPANPAANENQADGTHVQKGGGFIPYDTPKAPGHYSFRTQGHVGGILKKGKLQWFAGFKDNQNYILFSLDGKHAEVREMRNGKSILWSRVPCSVDSSSWVQVDMAVKSGAVSSRVKTAGEGWVDLGSVASFGRDFTQDRVGFYIPPNDEVAVANFKFANR